MIEIFIGHKITSFFDIWSIEHVISGVSMGSLAIHYAGELISEFAGPGKSGLDVKREGRFGAASLRLDIIIVLLMAFLWETFEHYLESGLWGNAVTYWFQGVEAWHNRCLSDPLMLIVGYCIVRRYPGLVWPARVLSFLWLVIHIFIFPHSMYIHDLLGRLW